MAIEHVEFLEEILQILTEDADESSKKPEEIMAEIVAIIDDYKSELTQEETEQEERDKLSMMGIDPDADEETDENEVDASVTAVTKPINRAFLLTKAQKDYYKKLGLTDEEVEDLSPSEKMKHRKGITALFNKMVIAASEKSDTPSQYAKGPFKKTGSVRRLAVSDDNDDEDSVDVTEVTPAELKWKRQQTKELKTNIKSLAVEIDELKRQNRIKKISPSIVNRNNERIAELEQQLEDIEEQKKLYS